MIIGNPSALDPSIARARRFNRFYTRRLGVLDEGLYHTRFSLTESRVLYELAHRSSLTATALGKDLGLDPGYLSRILHRFENGRLIAKTPSESDGRQSLVRLTPGGRAAFAPLDACSRRETGAMLSRLSNSDQNRLLDAMNTIEILLGGTNEKATPAYLLRDHQPGDMGWVVHRHGVLYAQEYGYDEHFEALVASIVAEFIAHYNPKWERCWMAEQGGVLVGSVFLVRKSKTIAKLRLLFVEPAARGLGIGARLVRECIRFARQAGYKKIALWTQSELKAARHIYDQAGFTLVGKKPHCSWGKNLVAETWELKL
jgi:DNA-binding MarR family transcriptional regulator/N-acetylglutamate synthase-like GNAT family acetyltransferase